MILMYHKVHPDSPSMWWVHVNDFYRQMYEIANREVVYFEDYDMNNHNHIVITFDGIYKNVLQYALPILKHFDYPFELFVTSDYLGLGNDFDTVEPSAPFTNESELLELVNGGGRLQWHTQSHIDLKNVHDLDVIVKELTIPENMKALDIKGFTWFAYPYGEFNKTVVEEVKKRFMGAVSCVQGNDSDMFLLNRITVTNKTSLRGNKIACIIASYNYGAYLIEAIESVLRQTILPDEILITDDCSDDETQIIAENYAKKYPDLISYNRNKINMGIVNHFNKAVSLTKSEYVFFLGADNRLLSNYIEETAKMLESNPNVAIAYTDYAFFGPRAELMYQTYTEDRKSGVIEGVFYQIFFPSFNNKEDLVLAIEKGNFIHGSSMFRRKVFQDIGGYVQTTSAEDYNLFKRMLEKGWVAKKAKATNLEYRQHNIKQANNLFSIQSRMLFYKKAYLEKNTFEKSRIYKISHKLYMIKGFVIKNYTNPKVIFYKLRKFI